MQQRVFLDKQRSDKAFDAFYQATLMEARTYNLEPVLPRQRRMPARLDDGAPCHQFTSTQDYCRMQYFEALDLLMGEICRRFDRPSFVMLQEIEKLLTDSCNGTKVELPCTLRTCMLVVSRWTVLWPNCRCYQILRTANSEHNMGIKKVTSVNTICDLFQYSVGAFEFLR